MVDSDVAWITRRLAGQSRYARVRPDGEALIVAGEG